MSHFYTRLLSDCSSFHGPCVDVLFGAVDLHAIPQRFHPRALVDRVQHAQDIAAQLLEVPIAHRAAFHEGFGGEFDDTAHGKKDLGSAVAEQSFASDYQRLARTQRKRLRS